MLPLNLYPCPSHAFPQSQSLVKKRRVMKLLNFLLFINSLWSWKILNTMVIFYFSCFRNFIFLLPGELKSDSYLLPRTFDSKLSWLSTLISHGAGSWGLGGADEWLHCHLLHFITHLHSYFPSAPNKSF